jgi:hypothetical protein
MAWAPKEKEIAALLSADGKRRYAYFIHRVCDTRKIWGLYDDGWASLGDGEKKLLPLWPHQAFAVRFARGDWRAYEPRDVDLDVFLADWIPRLTAEGVEPAVFPDAGGSAVIVSAAALDANLRHELAESYGEER